MWLGNNNWFKSLIFLILTQNVFSNPLIGVFEASMESYFMASGIEQSQASRDAKNLSKSVFDSQIKKDIQSGNYEFEDSSSFFKSTFEKETSKNIEFREKKIFSDNVNSSISNPYKKGGEGIIFHIMDAGNYQDKEALRKMYKEMGFDIVFKTKVSYQELSEYIQSRNGIDYAIAPDWYASSGMFLYKTELPINRDGDYFYANKPFSFYEMGLNSGLIKIDEQLVEIDLGLDSKGLPLKFPVYREEFEFYSDEKDAILNFNNSYGRRFSLEYVFEKRIFDHSAKSDESKNYGVRSIDEAKQHCENYGGIEKITGEGNYNEKLYHCLNSYLNLEHNFVVGVPQEGTGVLLLEKK